MAFDILIVDDSPAMRAFVRRVISLSGFAVGECHTASNGQEALDLLRRHRVDVVLTDINMPTMDGEELVRNLEADPSLCSIPVVVVSTDSTQNRVQRLLKIGAKGYVTKPFAPETLQEELERVLGEAHARQ